MIDAYPPPLQHCCRRHRIGIISTNHLIDYQEKAATRSVFFTMLGENCLKTTKDTFLFFSNLLILTTKKLKKGDDEMSNGNNNNFDNALD